MCSRRFNSRKAFFKYPNAFETQMPISGGGCILNVVAKRVAYVSGKYKLTFPILNYVVVDNSPGFSRSRFSQSGLYNEIKNQPAFNLLNVNDTIAWQSFDLVFAKQ